MRKDHSGKRYGRWTVIRFSRIGNKRRSYWLCKCDCGVEKEVESTTFVTGTSKSCGCLRRELSSVMCKKRIGVNHPSWKGGFWIDKNGYKIVQCVHPRACKGYLTEHILVMEKHLNRYLVKGETIHHKNGIRSDNRPENLELKIGNHGHGVTLEDHKRYIIEQVRLYLPELEGVTLKY